MCLIFTHYSHMQQYVFYNWAFGHLTLENPLKKPSLQLNKHMTSILHITNDNIPQ